jgi:hypothetical protein
MPMFPLRVRGPFDLKPASGTTMWASFAFPHKPLIIVVLTGVPQTTGLLLVNHLAQMQREAGQQIGASRR